MGPTPPDRLTRVALLRIVALRALFGARNGLIYGAKVRAPHSLVMTALWSSDSLRRKLMEILNATASHSMRLATYAFLYKLSFNSLAVLQREVALLRRAQDAASLLSADALPGNSGRREPGAVWRAAIAGAIAGGTVFRKDSSINQQIVFYLFSRTVVGLVKKVGADASPRTKSAAWPAFAAACWAGVMAMWELDRAHLQKGLVSSMDFIYRESDNVSGAWDALFDVTEWRKGLNYR